MAAIGFPTDRPTLDEVAARMQRIKAGAAAVRHAIAEGHTPALPHPNPTSPSYHTQAQAPDSSAHPAAHVPPQTSARPTDLPPQTTRAEPVIASSQASQSEPIAPETSAPTSTDPEAVDSSHSTSAAGTFESSRHPTTDHLEQPLEDAAPVMITARPFPMTAVLDDEPEESEPKSTIEAVEHPNAPTPAPAGFEDFDAALEGRDDDALDEDEDDYPDEGMDDFADLAAAPHSRSWISVTIGAVILSALGVGGYAYVRQQASTIDEAAPEAAEDSEAPLPEAPLEHETPTNVAASEQHEALPEEIVDADEAPDHNTVSAEDEASTRNSPSPEASESSKAMDIAASAAAPIDPPADEPSNTDSVASPRDVTGKPHSPTASAPPPPEVIQKIDEARQLYERGGTKSLTQARTLLDEVVDAYPADSLALALLANVQLEQRESEASRATATRCVNVAPDLAPCWLVLAVLDEAQLKSGSNTAQTDEINRLQALVEFHLYANLAPEGRYYQDALRAIDRLTPSDSQPASHD